MCFPQAIKLPRLQQTPSNANAQTQRRVDDATRPNPGLTSILTSPLGDPNFGKNINRTVLTGILG